MRKLPVHIVLNQSLEAAAAAAVAASEATVAEAAAAAASAAIVRKTERNGRAQKRTQSCYIQTGVSSSLHV